jgi:hypothetical protein
MSDLEVSEHGGWHRWQAAHTLILPSSYSSQKVKLCPIHRGFIAMSGHLPGIKNHIWTIEEMVKLLDGRSIHVGLQKIA